MRELPFKVGDEIKNYKEMCKLLGEKERTSNSRKSQMTRWEKYFKWEKNGHKFLITEIDNKNYPTHDNNRIDQGVKKHSQELQSLLLHFLKAHHKQHNSYWLTISMKGLINLIQIFRKEIHTIAYSEWYTKAFSEKFQVKDKFIQDFYQRVYSTTSNDIKTALKQLEGKGIIAVEEIYMGRPSETLHKGLPTSHLSKLQQRLSEINLNDMFISYVNHFKVISDDQYNDYNEIYQNTKTFKELRPLEPFETNVFLGLRNSLLKKMNYSSLHKVYQLNEESKFYEKLNQELREYMKINYVSKGYRIIFLPHIIEEEEIFQTFELDEKVLSNLTHIFQKGFSSNIIENYSIRKDKSLSKNAHHGVQSENSDAIVCELTNNGLTSVDKLLLGIDNMEEVVQEMLSYFLQDKNQRQ